MKIIYMNYGILFFRFFANSLTFATNRIAQKSMFLNDRIVIFILFSREETLSQIIVEY